MAEDDKTQVYAFCNLCKENVPLDITGTNVEDAKSGLVTVLSIHGDPQHAILVYLDKQLKVRGTEYPSMLQIKYGTSQEKPKETKEGRIYDLGQVISAFGDKQDAAISSFAQISAQIILGNSLYLIHTNTAIANVVKEQLDALFAEQRTYLFVITYDEIDTVSGMRPTIFDLQYGNFISKGVAMDTVYFEQLINDALSEPNGFSLLKNEFSKLKFSYRRLWELLSAGAKKFTQKRLAYLVSIDESLMPLLLKIAENDGIDVKSRIR